MMSQTGSNNKKNLNVELNLMPVFDVLSVCICFLLMTVVWVQVAGLQTSQAIGDGATEAIQHSSVWLSINENNDLEVSLRNAENIRSITVIENEKGLINWKSAETKLKTLSPTEYKNAIILPSKNTKYENVIHFMDLVKQSGIKDVGVSPI
ncbi:MAG: ExbD/TolR family protein [Pseudobdellovibrionaceae bacterium]|jgi:biopolymer transport protein ExbD